MAAPSRSWYLVFLCAAGIAGIAASALWHHVRPRVELTTGEMLAPRRQLPQFSLTDQQGRTFGNADLRGRWSFMFFGYTNCPDFCPTTLATLAALQKRLRAAKQALPRVIFVSVDARRDTPAQLAKYVPYFDPGFIGLTAADQPAIEATARALGVGVIIRPTADGNYTVDHSGVIFVLDPEGRLAAILSGPFTVNGLQDDYRRLVDSRA